MQTDQRLPAPMVAGIWRGPRRAARLARPGPVLAGRAVKVTQAYRFALDPSRMNGSRAKARRLLADPAVTTAVVGYKDRLAA